MDVTAISLEALGAAREADTAADRHDAEITEIARDTIAFLLTFEPKCEGNGGLSRLARDGSGGQALKRSLFEAPLPSWPNISERSHALKPFDLGPRWV